MSFSSAIDEAMVQAEAHTLRIMDPRLGDLKVVWEADNADEVQLARDQFEAAKRKGMVAYRVDKKGKKAEVVREFDKDAEALIMAPPLVGG